MKYTVYDRLLQREVGHQRKRYTDIRGIYGDRQWVEDMDIVNELEGHHGCVNALSWSTSGRLLASGSDDHRINIHSYHPESSTSQFSLTTSILTGHRTNIFSVKFMPYSNDRTIVSATDDVRIFDIEHSGHSAFGSASRSSTGRRRTLTEPDGLTLTETDTNAKAYRCHSDTVKRIVTEDNPFYFLTCSNDGDVRQWDIRQPSKAYPTVRDTMLPDWARDADGSDSAPPPLISYSRFGLDLNSVSCSPSQPHYIALGGAHLHCFLHDRRMLGRDTSSERGSRLSSPWTWSENDDELLGKATQCVKKFAPHGKQRMKRNDGGHITACKISDAHPNELLVSWSQDHIYSFDMLRAPDVNEQVTQTQVSGGDSHYRVKDESKKRKRKHHRVLPQEAGERADSRQRTESPDGDLALRVTYGNGQSEDLHIQSPTGTSMTRQELSDLRSTDHYRIARGTAKIGNLIFDLGEHGDIGLKLAFTSILGYACSILTDMDNLSRTWGYPVNPSPLDLAMQKKLREQRASARRFVQAAGTLARAMGGQLLTGANSDALISQHFATIQPAPREQEVQQHEQFGYDFLKAILLWLDSGPGAVVEGFSARSPSSRFPIPYGSDMDAIDDYLTPYLLELAGDDPIVNLDASQFETDDTRILYPTEQAAVTAFAQTLKIPFADLTGGLMRSSRDISAQSDTQDRETAKRKWVYQIGRSVLRNASKDIKFASVDLAFGGNGIIANRIEAREKALMELYEDVNPLDEASQTSEAERPGQSLVEVGSNSFAAEGNNAEDIEEDEEDTDRHVDSDSEDDQVDSEDEDEDEEGLRRTRSGRMLWRSDFGQSSYKREKVERDVPCAPHTRVYVGHCNVKTVKDVNYFGLQDEYVVSGCDSGNVFIWDRKTGQLVNVLEGDEEVVNVVQGHPYEPTMAVSGIDNTIKIFSPDIRLQRNARKGFGVQSSDPSTFSSLNWGRRRRGAQVSAPEPEPSGEALSESDEEVAANGLRSRKRMSKAYEITSKNDMDRKGGRDDYFISQAVFTQLARHIAARRAGGEEGEDGDGGPIILNEDNCASM